YKTIVGLVLLVAALLLSLNANKATEQTKLKPIPLGFALLSGAVIGLLSGLTGTGGGIFLSPLLLFNGWTDTRPASGLSAAFILANSVAGLLGSLSSVGSLPASIFILAPVAMAGGYIGSHFGSKSIGSPGLRRLLSVVLIVAGLKLILT